MKKQHMTFLTFILFTSLLMWGCAEEQAEVTPQTEEQAAVKERRAAIFGIRVGCILARPSSGCASGFGLCECFARVGAQSTMSVVGGNASVNGNYLHIAFDDDSLFTENEFIFESGEEIIISDTIANGLGYEYLVVEPGSNVAITYDDEECPNGCADFLIVDSALLEQE